MAFLYPIKKWHFADFKQPPIILAVLVHVYLVEISPSDWFVILLCQIKEDMKRPVYCALIQLLQDKDLSVRVCTFPYVNVVFSVGLSALVFGCIPWLLLACVLFLF